jgi:hypothetical protein
MQQDADFITADFLYMFRASCVHHQEYRILIRQPLVQVVMVACGSSLRHIRVETIVFYTPDDGRMTPEACTESLQ